MKVKINEEKNVVLATLQDMFMQKDPHFVVRLTLPTIF